MATKIIEICAASIESARNAALGGAHRIELCSALSEGGVTPSVGLLLACRALLTIPICVLIRPREGDFCYSDLEMKAMAEDISFCRKIGVAGVVVGALLPNGDLDLKKMSQFKELAGEMELVCHRAFDHTRQPERALEQLIELGYARVLTSGGRRTAWEGRDLIAKLVKIAKNRISIMPGSGVTAQNAVELLKFTQATEIHSSAKKLVKNLQTQRSGEILFSDYYESDVEIIKNIVENVTKIR